MSSRRSYSQICLLSFVATLLFSANPASGKSYLGNFTSYSSKGNAVTVCAGESALRFVLYKTNLVRVDYLPALSTHPGTSPVIIRSANHPVSYRIENDDSTFSIRTASLRITCLKFPVRVSFFNSAGKLLVQEPVSGGISSTRSGITARFAVDSAEHFYGTGERGSGFDLYGQAFDSFNEQHGGYPTGGIPATMNVNIPFLISTREYGIYFDDTYEGHFDIGHTDRQILTYRADGGTLSYFFIEDSTMAGVLSGYTWLTGRAPLLPRWAYGYIQSKFGYRDSSQAYRMIRKMRRDSIPCDAIVLDLYWFRNMGDLSWNTASWPDPHRITSGFLSRGFRTIVITEPYIVRRSVNFSEADRKGYLVKRASGKSYILKHWWSCGCKAGLLDITNPAAQEWLWGKYREIFKTGVSGIWTDLGEPERDNRSMVFKGGPDLKIHNMYDFLWAKTLFDGYNRSFPNRRFFNLTRSGYAGIQRFGTVTWSGDVAKTFAGLAVQLPILMNMGMSGITYHNSDIGGFTGNRPTTPELYTRWMEFGAFCPVMRAHGYDGLGGTEPWAFGAKTEKIVRKIIDLRYSLLPYNYTMAHESYSSGIPLARPLVLGYKNDRNVADESAAYMWGDDFLVAPVVRPGTTSKTFYIPQGKWIDYWNDSIFVGGKEVTVPAPIDEIPLFVKSGSIIPMQPPMEYTGEFPPDTVLLAIYPDSDSHSTFSLYEDDGKSLGYQHGSYSETRFSMTTTCTGKFANMQISIGPSVGHYEGKPQRRMYVCEIHQISSQPGQVIFRNSGLHEISSREIWLSSGQGYKYDSTAKILFVKVPVNTDSAYSIAIDHLAVLSR